MTSGSELSNLSVILSWWDLLLSIKGGGSLFLTISLLKPPSFPSHPIASLNWALLLSAVAPPLPRHSSPWGCGRAIWSSLPWNCSLFSDLQGSSAFNDRFSLKIVSSSCAVGHTEWRNGLSHCVTNWIWVFWGLTTRPGEVGSLSITCLTFWVVQLLLPLTLLGRGFAEGVFSSVQCIHTAFSWLPLWIPAAFLPPSSSFFETIHLALIFSFISNYHVTCNNFQHLSTLWTQENNTVAGACSSFWGSTIGTCWLNVWCICMCMCACVRVCLRVSVLVFPKAGAGCWVLPHFLLPQDWVSLSELSAAYFLCSLTTKFLGLPVCLTLGVIGTCSRAWIIRKF